MSNPIKFDLDELEKELDAQERQENSQLFDIDELEGEMDMQETEGLVYNPSQRWSNPTPTSSPADYPFTSGIKPTKVEKPYATISEQIAEQMTPVTPEAIAEQLPEYKSALDIEEGRKKAFEENFTTNPEYRAKWFQENTGMTEEEFKASQQAQFAQRFESLIPRAEAIFNKNIEDNAKQRGGTGLIRTIENLGSSMAAKSKLDELRGLSASFKHNNLWSGMYEGTDLLDVLSGGLADFASEKAYNEALKKQANGEELTEEEQFAIDASDLYDDINETFEVLGGRSGWNKTGKTVGQSAEFTAGMLPTSGLGFATGLMKSLGLKAGWKAVKTAAGNGLRAALGESLKQGGKVLGRGLYNLGLSYAESIPRAAIMPGTYSRYLELRNERLKNGESLEGNWLQDAGRAGIEMTNEIASEIWGSTFIHDSFRAMGKALGIDKAMDAVGLGRRRRTMFGWTPSAATREAMRNLGYSGDYLSEVTSEAAGDVATNLAMGVFFDDAKWEEMKTREYWTTLLGATALQGSAFQTINTLANIPEYKRLTSIQQKRDKAVKDIQSEQLRKDIEMAFTYDDAAEMGKALAAIDWNAYNRIDVANAMDAVRLEVPLRIATGERAESERVAKFAPHLQETLSQAYQGVDANNPMPQAIIVDAVTDEGANVRIMSGDYHNPDAMLNVVDMNTGKSMPILASKVMNINEVSIQQRVQEDYRLMFSTEENVERLGRVMQTLDNFAYYNAMTSADAIDIVERAGFTVYGVGSIVTLVDGQQVEIAAPMMSDGHYLVRDANGNASVVGLLDVLQPAMEVVEAQVQIAREQEQQDTAEATEAVEKAVAEAMPQSPMPEGVAYGEAWVTPQGIGRVVEYNPQTGKVYMDINLSSPVESDIENEEIIEVDVTDLQRKPTEGEMQDAQARSVRRNALMINDETSSPLGAIQEQVEQPAMEVGEVEAEQPTTSVPSMENVPTTADGIVDYDAITDADMYARLLTQDLGSKEEALEAVNTSIEGYTAEVSELQEKAKKEKNMTQRVALTKQAAAVQQQLDVLNEVRKSLGEGANIQTVQGGAQFDDEKIELQNKIQAWLTPENISWAEGKDLNDSIEKFGNEVEPIAVLPTILKDYFPEISSPYLYSGKGYLIDHAANHHPELAPEEYNKIQEVIDSYDDIKDLSTPNTKKVAFVKMLDKGFAVVTELAEKDGKIMLHKTFFYKDAQGKRVPYKNKPSLLKKLSVDGSTTISPAETAAGRHRKISALDTSSESKNTTSIPNMQEVEQKNVGLMQDDFTVTLPNGEAELIDSLARSLGLSVELVDKVNEGNSNAQILGNKVLIAKKNRDKAIKFLVGHEFTHRMQDLSPKAYAEFKAAVKEYMGEELYNTLLQKEIAKYRQHNIYRTQEQLEDEVIADFAGSLAFETDVLDTFIAAHADKKTMWQAILDVLRAIREWILKDTAYDTAEARALQNAIGKLETLFQSASEKVAEGATAQSTEARRSLKEQVAEILDEYNTEGVQYSTPRDVADALEGVIAEASEDTTMLENIIADFRNAQDDSRSWGERWDSGGEEAFIEALQMWSSPNTQYSDALYSFKETDNRGKDRNPLKEADNLYLDAVARGDMAMAQRMVQEAAEHAGYLPDTSYQGSLAFNGAAPTSNVYFKTKEERKQAWDNEEFDDTMSLGDYADNSIDTNDLEWRLTNAGNYRRATQYEKESIDNINKALKNPERKITIYRAVPSSVVEGSVRNGDWVTPSRSYAEYHIGLQDWEGGRVIEQEVSIDDIWWGGDDIKEWGYDDGSNYGYRNTENNRKLLDTVTYDDAGNIIPLSERFNPEKADVRYSAKDIPSLVGVHNISLEKLRKVIKMGGSLANPSVAVLDIDKSDHTDYGEYSLILSKNMVDARLGRNAGTWAGDAWTPTYPPIIKQIKNSKDVSRFYKDINKLPEEIRNRVSLQFDSYLEGRDANSFYYWFLFENGMAPDLQIIPSRYSDEIVSALQDATDGRMQLYGLSPEQRMKVLDVFIQQYYQGDKAEFEATLQNRIDRLQGLTNHQREAVRKRAQQDLADIQEYGFDYDEVAEFVRDVERDISNRGRVDVEATIRSAKESVEQNNLSDNFDKWRDAIEERYGIEEFIFNGYTPSGTRKYLPHTTENVSKYMKKQGRTGAASSFPSFGLFIATIIPRMTNLDSIRKRKGQLGNSEQAYNDFKEKWEDVYYGLGLKLQPDAERFEDYGFWRLIEAASKPNPQKYIKGQYNIDFSNEDMATLNEMLEAIKKSYPARYFETKFERPVELTEFVAAVVPDNIPSDVEDYLRKSYLNIYKYDKESESSRREATLKAVDSPSIRFSLKDTFYSNAENAVRLIKQEKATPEQWLKMIEKNGGLKAGEDKWLGLSDWLKEQMRGPVKEKPTAININGTEYNVKELEEQILSDIKAMLEEEGFDDELIGIRLVGSYMRGEQRPDSDIDVIVEYKGGSTEDTLFNVLNDEDRRINIGGVDVDINPITEGKSGTLDEWEKRNAGFTKKPITLTKDEVLDYIHQNQIKIEEVNYAEVGSPFIDRATRKLEAEMKEIGIEAMREKYPDFDDFFEVFQGELVWSEQKASEGEYEDYIIENNILDVDTEAEAINETRLRYTTNGLDNNREIALTVPTIEPWNASDAVHFGDAGGGRAVAWIRFGETTDAEGKRVLVIDEIQSKRHQEGREKGYRSDEDVKNAKARLDALQLEQNALVEEIRQGLDESSLDYARAPLGIIGTDEQKAKMKEYDKALNEASREYRKLVYDTIPNAPFEKNWAELAMKRMLRYAAENGYDKVAWTTGEQQADRYNMSTSVSKISRRDNNLVEGKRFMLGGNTVLPHKITINDEGIVISSTLEGLEGKPLADVVGKEMAVKMMQMENNTSLEDADLKIGGSGMKAFYDQMLPSFVRKYAKKWGATVGEVTMPNLEENNTMHSVDVTPAMRESVMQGQPLFSLKNDIAFNNKVEDARQIAEEYNIPQAIFITDTTDEYIALMHDMGIENFDKRNRRGCYISKEDAICLNGGNLTKHSLLFSTLIHEYTHSVTRILREELKAIKESLNEADILAFRDNELPQYENISALRTLNEIISKFVGEIRRKDYGKIMNGEGDITAIVTDAINQMKEYQEIFLSLTPIIIKNLEYQKIKYNERKEKVPIIIPRRGGNIKVDSREYSQELEGRGNLGSLRNGAGYRGRGVGTNRETQVIKTQSNDEGRINGGDVLISGRGYRPSVEEATGDRGLGYRGVQSPSIGEDVRRSQEVSNLEATEQFARQSVKDNVGDDVAERLERIHQDKIARINRFYDDRIILVERRAAEIARQTNGTYKRSWSNAQKIDFLFPDGVTAAPIADQVLADIARGQKLRWNDSPDGRKRGLSTELGLDSARAEGMGAVTNGATTYVEDYIEQLYEANNGYERGLDDQDIRNAVLDMFSRYPSPKAALQELEDTYINAAENESAEEALRHIDIERENALREENRRYAEDLARYAENPQLVRDDFFASDMQAEFIKEEANAVYAIERKVRTLQKRLDNLRSKQRVSRAEQKQIIDEIKQEIRKALNPRNARYFNSVKLRSLINTIDASYTIKGMARAMDRVLSTFFDVNYRLEKERRDALTKSKINFNTDSKSVESYLEGEVAAGHISKGTMERILADRWRGVNSRGVSVAKYIDGDTAIVMDFIAQNIKWDESKEPSAQRYELVDKAIDMGKEKNYSHDLIGDLINAAYILEDYWLAEQMLKVSESYSAELEQANKELTEIEIEMLASTSLDAEQRDEIIGGLQVALDEALRRKQALHDQHFADMPNIIAAMNRANNSVAAVLATGRVKLSQERYEKKKHEAEIVQDALDDLTNYGNPEEIAALDKALGISGINRQESWLEKTKQRMWDDYIWSLDYMLRSFGRFAPDGTGRVYMRFMPALNAAWSDYRKNLSEIQKRIDEKIRSLWGDKSKSWKRGIGHNPFNVMSEKAEEKHIATITYTKAAIAWNTSTTEGGAVEVSREKGTVTETMDLSLSQAMYLLASWGQSDGRMKLEANGIKEEHIAEVRMAIQRYDERYLDFMDWVIADLLPSLRERYNEVHRQLFGTYMTSVDNYFPLKVTDKGRYIAEDVSQEKGDKAPLSINPGAIINRTHNTNMIDLKQNFFKVLAENISEMERWATMMPVAADINALMSNGTVRNYTKAAFGPSFHTQLRDRFAVATGQGIRSPKLGMESTINTAMRYWASTKIGFRFFTAFKQIASLPAILTYSMSPDFLAEVGVNLTKGISTLGVYSFRYCIDKFPMFRERVANLRAGDITLMKAIEEGSTQVAERYKGAFKTIKTTGKMLDAFAQYLGKAGFAANMWVDALSSGIIAMSVYNYEYERLQKQGYTAEQADKMAIFFAENAFNQTQQSAEYAYLAPGQLSPRMFDKAITVFQNSTFLYTRQGVQGLHEIKKSLLKSEKMRDNIQRREARRLHDLYISQGLSEEEAQAKAAQEARRIATQEWKKVAIHGAGGVAWGLFLGNYIFSVIGNLFAYCNFWDDDDERNRLLWEDVKWNLLFSPVRGFPGGGSVMGFIQYGRFEPFGAMSEFSEDIAEIYKMLNKVGEDGFNEQIAWLALEYAGRWGIGVDANTVTNLYKGIESMVESGMSTEAIMLFLNAPQSQMRLIAGKKREGETFKQYLDRVRRVQTKYDVDMSKVPYYTDEGAFIGSDETQRMTEKQENALRTVYRQYEEAYRKDVLQRTRPEMNKDWADTEERYKKVVKSLGWTANKNPNDDRAFNEAGDYISRMPREVYEKLYFLQGEVAYHVREAARFLGDESDYAKYLDSIYTNRKQLIQLYDDNSTK